MKRACLLATILAATSFGPVYGQEGGLSARVQGDEILIVRDGQADPILVQNSKADFRPYLHPIVAPDGKGHLTEFSPGHHKHQTGLYWGFTRVNQRDHFHNPGNNYFKRKSARVISAEGSVARWEVIYDLQDAKGRPVLAEAKRWTLRDNGDHYVLDLAWSGEGQADVTIGKYNYGGLFLRMPWKRGIKGHAVNAQGLKNRQAEGKRSEWVDVAMQVKGRDDLAHMVIMDHPDNPGYPTPWRVDGQLGVGPCFARLGDWKIPKGRTRTFRHRILIYTGPDNAELIKKAWAQHTQGPKNAPGVPQAAPVADANPNDPNNLILQIVATTPDPNVQASMLKGMLEGFKGRGKVRPPAQWAAVYPKLAKSPSVDVRNVSLKLAQVFGDTGADQRMLQTVQDAKAPAAKRREAMRLLIDGKATALKPVLPGLLDDPSLRHDAIRAYAAVEDEAAPGRLLDRYPKLGASDRRAVVETLAARRAYHAALFKAIKSGAVPKSDVPTYTARHLQRTRGKAFAAVWGDLKAASADKAKQIAKYKKLLTDAYVAKGDAAKGRAIFARTCGACHRMYDAGGVVGPDITGSNRADLDYILYQMIDPNDDVPEAYRMVVVTTKGGQSVAGRIVEEDDQRLVLQTPAEQKTVAKNQIKSRQVLAMSMMPEGLLSALKNDEVRDLVLYLRSTQQVPLPQ